jgi:hypothetical protein
MSQSITLPDDLVKDLTVHADRMGLSLVDYVIYRLDAPSPPSSVITTGAELVEYWKAAGVIGTRPDIQDSQQEARNLREKAQRRGG